MSGVIDAPYIDDRIDGRPAADRFMRRLLRVPARRSASLTGARNALGTSIVLSGIRCLFTYLLFPLAAPAFGLSGGVDGVVTLLLGVLAVVFSVSSMRRFWAADHRHRWTYTGFAGVIILWVVVDLSFRIV